MQTPKKATKANPDARGSDRVEVEDITDKYTPRKIQISQIQKQMQTGKDTKEISESLNTPSKKIQEKITVFIDEKFESMKENPNSMYIFKDISKIDFGRGTVYPAVNRKVHKWASKCKSNQQGNIARKFRCNGLEDQSCKAVRWQYYCEGVCRKKELDDSKCCKYGTERKLVVFFEGVHQCKNQLHEDSSMEDLERRIIENFPAYEIRTGYDELPDDLNNDVIFLLPLKPENEKPLIEQVRCGRRFEKLENRASTKEEKKVFGPYVPFTKGIATCKGFYKCSNTVCPYFVRFNLINQVIRP